MKSKQRSRPLIVHAHLKKKKSATPTAWKRTDVNTCWVGRVLALRGIPTCAFCASQMRHHHVHFYVCFSEEWTLSGERWVPATASLSEPEGIADVTSTEGKRFRLSTLAKPIDAPCSKHMQ